MFPPAAATDCPSALQPEPGQEGGGETALSGRYGEETEGGGAQGETEKAGDGGGREEGDQGLSQVT